MKAKFEKRVIFLREEAQRAAVMALVKNLPLDQKKPLTVTISEFKPVRGLDANALYWAGPLRDISEQAWLEGRKYSPEVWHEYFKIHLLPSEDEEDFDSSLVRDGYKKWDYGPDGERYLVGTTTMLTVRGMAQYIEQVLAFGGNLGVQFSVKPSDRGI